MKIIRHGDNILTEDGSPFLVAGFPSAYGLVKCGLPVLGRISEFEPVCRLFGCHLIDPIVKWTAPIYVGLIETTDLNHDLYIMMPSTHGHALDTDLAVAEVCAKYSRVKGLITKFKNELSDYSS